MSTWLEQLSSLCGVDLPSASELLRRAPRPPGEQRATQVLQTADSWWALTLSRDADRELVPALIQQDHVGSAQLDAGVLWEHVAAWSRSVSSAEALERAILLGLAASTLPGEVAALAPIAVVPAQRRAPTVLDLSALWAGPLAGHLLNLAGAKVLKVESEQRPDGLRQGDPALFERLNSGKESIRLPLSRMAGRGQLLELIEAADIVLESSRPRALAQLGVDAPALLQAHPELLWVSITAYGRQAAPERIGFGDDIAFGAGLVDVSTTGPRIRGDALADPLTGTYAALAAYSRWLADDAGMLDISMHQVAHAAA